MGFGRRDIRRLEREGDVEGLVELLPAGGGRPGPAVKILAGESMAKLGFGRRDIRRLERERDVEGLVELLRHKDEKVAFQAIEALTRLGDKRGVEALMALVVDPSTTELIRAKAWLALDVGLAREARKRTDWK